MRDAPALLLCAAPALLIVAGCVGGAKAPDAPPNTAPSASAEKNPLELPETSPALQNAKTRQRLLESPHSCLRAVNLDFAKLVCQRFAPVMGSLPRVNLHGDAHIEQLAITDHSVGLSDFDDSVTGPPVIDLVRFGTSIAVTAKEKGWPAEPLLNAFFASYKSTLEGGPPPPMPAVVARVRKGFASSRVAFLDWAESRMTPAPARLKTEVKQGHARYVKLMLRRDPGKTAAFFEMKAWGLLIGQGIGSAGSRRYLARVEGPSKSPEDDIILEAKEVRDLSEVGCVSSRRGDALRVITGSVSFRGRPDPFLAVIPRRAGASNSDPPWWIQSWKSNYAELDIHLSLTSAAELEKVVALIGSQMATGHTSTLPKPAEVRAQLMKMLREQRPAMDAAIVELTELTLKAHRALVRRNGQSISG